jgi:hypothetical protein
MSKIKTSGKQKIVFKIQDHFSISYEDMVDLFQGKVKKKITDKDFVTQWIDVKKQFPSLVLKPIFTSVSPNVIEELTDKAIRNDPSYKPVNFLRYFYAIAENKKAAIKIHKALTGTPLFEHIEIRNKISSPSSVDATNEPNYRDGLQEYLKDAPIGINVQAAWSETGGNGADINLVDFEFGWHLKDGVPSLDGSIVYNIDHEDFLLAPPSTEYKYAKLWYGTNSGTDEQKQHGTSVLGIIASQQNEKGGIGIAPACNIHCFDVTNPSHIDDLDFNDIVDDAIMYAISKFKEGDIFLLELQSGDEVGGPPIETIPIIFNLIRFATALNIVVIEAAGNSPTDLDMYYPDLNHTNMGDSGAIIVGGVNHVTRKRESGGFGERIDCYAWYTGVTTSSSPISNYLPFIGTSLATAIIAGAAVVLQGIIQEKFHRKYNSWQMRSLLSNPTTGIASNAPSMDKVGVMPNLREVIAKLNSADVDVYIRDNLFDIGERHMGAVAVSPDIITKINNTPANLIDFRTNRGMRPSDDVIRNQDNYIYIRVQNRGTVAASDVQVRVYYSFPATLLTPSLWIPIGFVNSESYSTLIPNVRAGNILTVSNPITFNTDSPAGHYCYVCVISNSFDDRNDTTRLLPHQLPATPLTSDEFLRLIRDNNNITWKNFNVIEIESVSATSVEMPFLMVGDETKSEIFEFAFICILPKDAEVYLEIPNTLLPVFKKSGYNNIQIGKLKSRVSWKNLKCLHLKNLKLPKGLKEQCKLVIQFPENAISKIDYQLSITQYYKNNILGKITWVIRKKNKSNNIFQQVKWSLKKKKLPF